MPCRLRQCAWLLLAVGGVHLLRETLRATAPPPAAALRSMAPVSAVRRTRSSAAAASPSAPPRLHSPPPSAASRASASRHDRPSRLAPLRRASEQPTRTPHAPTTPQPSPRTPPPPPPAAIAPPAAFSSEARPSHSVRAAVQLPRRVPCIELADIRAAYARCAKGSPSAAAAATVVCHRSKEKTCATRAAAVSAIRCAAAAVPAPAPLDSLADESERGFTPQQQALPRLNATASGRRAQSLAGDAGRPRWRGGQGGQELGVGWSAVVFGMAIHHAAEIDALLQAAADTWLQMTAGSDLLLMTDGDDFRSDEAVAPRTHERVAVYVHRCSECRRAACVNSHGLAHNRSNCSGFREGWLARRKVLHLLVAMTERYPPRTNKRFFFKYAWRSSVFGDPLILIDDLAKVDPDTLVVPANLLLLLTELQAILGSVQPYLFGMAACRVHSFALCHAAGGAGYGMTRSAMSAIYKYVSLNYPSFLERVDRFTYGGEDVTVAYALKKQVAQESEIVSSMHASFKSGYCMIGVSVINVGCMYQHRPDTYSHLHDHGEDWVHWPLSSTPISFHKYKDASTLRRTFSCSLYTALGQLRSMPDALFPSTIPIGVSPSSSSCTHAWATPHSHGAPSRPDVNVSFGIGGKSWMPRGDAAAQSTASSAFSWTRIPSQH